MKLFFPKKESNVSQQNNDKGSLINRRNFLKITASAAAAVFFSKFIPGKLLAEKVYAEENNMYPATVKEVEKLVERGELTNVSWDSLEAWGYDQIDFITADEWSGFAIYVNGSFFSNAEQSDLEKRMYGEFRKKKGIMTTDPQGTIYAGMGEEGFYPEIVILNNFSRMKGKSKSQGTAKSFIVRVGRYNAHELKLMRGEDKTAYAVLLNDKSGYMVTMDLVTGHSWVDKIPKEEALEYFPEIG